MTSFAAATGFESGVGANYDAYVQRRDGFSRLEAGVAYLRERYGKQIEVYITWLLMRPRVT